MAFQVKIHQIRAFVEVARQGSIRGASRMLNMSQPALSKSIQELEEGLAAQLFFRRSKGMPVKVFISTPVLFLKSCAQRKRKFANDKGNWQGRLISAWGPVFPAV